MKPGTQSTAKGWLVFVLVVTGFGGTVYGMYLTRPQVATAHAEEVKDHYFVRAFVLDRQVNIPRTDGYPSTSVCAEMRKIGWYLSQDSNEAVDVWKPLQSREDLQYGIKPDFKKLYELLKRHGHPGLAE